MARLRNIMPTSYPGIWSNDAKDTDGQPGKWVEDMEYYQMWDDGWKYYTMMQWQYDREYHMVWSLKNKLFGPKDSKEKRYIHLYANVGVVDEDVQIIETKVMGKTDNLPVWDEYGYPKNAIAHRISNHDWMFNSQYGDRYYLGDKNDNMGDVKWDLLYIAIWECWETMDNIEQI
jgi:hypothetical protein|tara:strand:- start:2541 stop:3062 length:522 start_codon:yes stop_codon:yes gene_type:complete